MGVDDFLTPIKSLGGNLITYSILTIVGLIVLCILGGVGIWAYRRKKWNLRIEIKIPRSDGRFVSSEKAKGHYNIIDGVVDVKRKGVKTVSMKPFDVRKYLQGENFLEVIQLSPNHYVPVLPQSYFILDDAGNKVALMNIEADIDKRKTWKLYAERTGKNRFTLKGFLDKHWRAIEMGIIVFIIFLGFSILWMRLPTVCT